MRRKRRRIVAPYQEMGIKISDAADAADAADASDDEMNQQPMGMSRLIGIWPMVPQFCRCCWAGEGGGRVGEGGKEGQTTHFCLMGLFTLPHNPFD